MKERYISLMAKTLSAYSDEHIHEYFDRVKREGLTEHGFPRLTANLGILIAHGVRTDLLPLFVEMMDFCCQTIPRVKAANDFSVREIVFCLMECEKNTHVPKKKCTEWRAALATIVPETCYTVFARAPEDDVRNWALFTAVSEHLRGYIGLSVSEEFIETQIASQLKFIDENGMYSDHKGTDVHQPIVYDLVPRGLFSILLHFGYRGRYYGDIDSLLRRAGLLSLRMQSVTGELPFGGRSNQFPHNEAWLSLIFEFEAARYDREGDLPLAAAFRAGIDRALGSIEEWLFKTPIRHVKNRFPTETKFGCEKYAYFDKYMITAASFLYGAYLLHEEPKAGGVLPREVKSDAFALTYRFHKLFLRHGDYFLEFDTKADPKYDASGLGRIHKAGAPSTVCLSVPCPLTPSYEVSSAEPIALSICPGILAGGAWHYAAEGAQYEVKSLTHNAESASTTLACRFDGGACVTAVYTVTDEGVRIDVSGDGDVGLMLPAFSFDGESHSVITAGTDTLDILYGGHVCRYTADGTVSDTGRVAYNRNGHYRVFTASGRNALTVRVEIV